MKKFLLAAFILSTLTPCAALACGYNSVANYQTKNTLVQNNQTTNYNGYRPYGYTIVSSGTNYISRDKATGEIKQVVQVGPPRPSYSSYYY